MLDSLVAARYPVGACSAVCQAPLAPSNEQAAQVVHL